jgi:exodeoxyribonuclease VII large subunit
VIDPSHSIFQAPISVSVLNTLTRQLVESNLPLLWITGELSNFTRAPSGHCYFTLKDANAQVRCTLFRHRSQYLDLMPKNGDCVEVRAQPTLYEPRGEFQLNVEYVRLAGIGRLYEAYERLKRKLEREGLFSDRYRDFPCCSGSARCVDHIAATHARNECHPLSHLGSR